MMYNHPAPVPFPCPVPIPTPVMIPVEPGLMQTILDTIEESKKDMMMEQQQHPLEEEVLRLAEALGSSNDECDPLGISPDIPVALLESLCDMDSPELVSKDADTEADERDVEASLPSMNIVLNDEKRARKRCVSSSQSSSSPKRLKQLTDAERSSSDGEEPDSELLDTQCSLQGVFSSHLLMYLFISRARISMHL